MSTLKASLAKLEMLRIRFEQALATASTSAGVIDASHRSKRLIETRSFGSNPGNLCMKAYVPVHLPKRAPLVVALHGCTQSAESYARGSGWSAIADDLNFAVLFPEQQRSNNANACFSWFHPADSARDCGEALSIWQMIERMIEDHDLDRSRVFIVGFSAGGAMAASMLAAYPDVFSAGAVIAGLAHRAANSVEQAFEAMAQGSARSPQDWGALVRSASTHKGPWPRIAIWHGSADAVVNPRNADNLISQWTDVHGLSIAAAQTHQGRGFTRRIWHTPGGEIAIEAYEIAGLGHGVPLAAGHGANRCGNSGAFHVDVGISSCHHIVRSWGLDTIHVPLEDAYPASVRDPVGIALEGEIVGATHDRPGDRSDGDRYDPSTIITAALRQAGLVDDEDLAGRPSQHGPNDPRSIITKTLKAVGLLRP